ncbi:hypothetical protein AWP67_22350 [Escherichia coli]|nr:hypothetical protein AWP67_22350 [Escherichia coli]
MWSPGYFASSCGGAPISVIRQYIEQQQTPGQVENRTYFSNVCAYFEAELVEMDGEPDHVHLLIN